MVNDGFFSAGRGLLVVGQIWYVPGRDVRWGDERQSTSVCIFRRADDLATTDATGVEGEMAVEQGTGRMEGFENYGLQVYGDSEGVKASQVLWLIKWRERGRVLQGAWVGIWTVRTE